MAHKKFLIFILLIFTPLYTLANNKPDIELIIMKQMPYGYINEKGEQTGVLFDILKAIKNKSEIKTKEIKLQATRRVIVSLNKNIETCTIVANTPDIIYKYNLVESIGHKISAGILPTSGIKLNNYIDLKGITIAVPHGIIFNNKFDKDDTLNKVYPPYYHNAIQMLKLKRVDAVAGAILTLKYLAKKENISEKDLDKELVLFQAEIFLVCNNKTNNKDVNSLKKHLLN